jgi:outer membrane protein TolC
MRWFKLILLLLVLALLPALAQLPWSSAECQAMTWQEARSAVDRRAVELQVAERREEVAAAEIRVAGALTNPTLTVTTARETARLSTGVVVPLPLFGQRGLAIRAARADALAVDGEGRVTRNDLRWSATLAWVDAWEAGERARLAVAASGDADRLLEVTEQRFQAGASPRLDVVRATADRARARADTETAQMLVDAAGARLAVWVGVDPAAPPTATGAPGVPAELPELGILMAALARHPALARDRAQQGAATERVKLERRLRFPIVSAEVIVNQWDPTLTDAEGVAHTDVIGGAAFELPVLDQRGGAIARAERQAELADATTSLDAVHLRAELADAYHRTLAGARRARQLGRSALPAMEEARAMTEESYRAGRADLVRVLEAHRAVLELRLAEREAIASWSRSFADLERALGDSLEQGGLTGDTP